MPNPHDTVDNVHDIIRDNHDLLRDWLNDAANTFRGQVLTNAALAHIERNVRPLTAAEIAAAGYLVSVIQDVLSHADRYRTPRDSMHALLNNAIGAHRTGHIQRATGLHPYAAAQLSVAMGHIESAARGR